MAGTGLVPSETHELVRNVVASPLSGHDSLGRCDLRPVVRSLDSAVRADPRLAGLPGRFLFALDDGRGDVVHESFDVGLLALDEQRAAVLVGSHRRGSVVDLADAPEAMVAAACGFLSARERFAPGAWHVREVADHLAASPLHLDLPPVPPRPVGAIGAHAVVGVPLGLLTRRHVDALSRVVDEVVVTPWRSLVVPGAAGHLPSLAEAGLVTSADSPWLRLHACTGAPGCARTDLDTRSIAIDLAPHLPAGNLPVHVSGCERRCGTPASGFHDLLSPATAGAALEQLRATAPVPQESTR